MSSSSPEPSSPKPFILFLKPRFDRFFVLSALWLLFAPLANTYGAAGDTADPFAHPPALEKDIRFWIRVYTEVTTDQGLLHDDWNLGLVYEVLRFDPASSPGQRERRVADAKAKYATLLRRFADGRTDDLTAHERRILHAFGDKATLSDYRDAIERIRFQLGQADRFHEGLLRAAVWEKQIARTLSQHGVPPEIAALPHVESSFNLAAYSKVGAAGLWQFMPSTAKRYMRVDNLVDERLDPYSATEAAANLMLYNYRLVGTWPLAVTAYNHGPGGLRRAQDELGTSDIAVIVKRFQGATFGFASRNFYVAFLAALEVDRHAEQYFGPITRLPDTDSTTVELPDYISVEALAKAFKADIGALRVLNPALRPPIWNNSRLVPRGYRMRLPGAQPPAEIAAGWSRLPLSQRYVAQRDDGSHRLRRGETLAGIAAASGMSVARLAAANGWSASHTVARGELVHIPMPASRAEVGGEGLLAATPVAPPAEGSPVGTAAAAGPAVPTALPAAVATAPGSAVPVALPATSAAVPGWAVPTALPATVATAPGSAVPVALPATSAAVPGSAVPAALPATTAATAGSAAPGRRPTTAAGAGLRAAAGSPVTATVNGGMPARSTTPTGLPTTTTTTTTATVNGGTRAGSTAAAGLLATTAAVNGGTPAVNTAAAGLPATAASTVLPAPVAQSVPAPAAASSQASPKVAQAPSEPVSERQTSNKDALLPVASPTGNSDTTNYAVAADDTVIVQAAETLGHFANWAQVDAQRLRALNKLRKNGGVTQGKKLKLDLSKVSAAQFEEARRAYHRQLQETYFAGYRIAGTQSYAVKRGDSLWTIAQQHGDLPVWLVAQYNPDVNFNDMRPGAALTLPVVAAINRQ